MKASDTFIWKKCSGGQGYAKCSIIEREQQDTQFEVADRECITLDDICFDDVNDRNIEKWSNEVGDPLFLEDVISTEERSEMI